MANKGTHCRNIGSAGPGRRKSRGFTLLELMIVVVVITILAILAVSSYQFANVKTRRNAAKGCLTQAAQYMERYYTTNMKYTGAPSPATICDAEVQKFYTVSFAGTPDDTTFTVQAVPTAMQKDSKCGTLTLNQAGTKTPTTEGCW
jgi:type IV pilus assembly protein PilE